ncbi:hypothetical protein EV363DRAFT_1200533 [Boletus edulis]|nr:hypothetical protein EV363DRAFT_1200533 [Boletus edulis]
MEARLLPAHLRRVKDEHRRATNTGYATPVTPRSANNSLSECVEKSASDVGDATPRSTMSSIGSLAGHLFALTLTDDGPSPNATSNKLWHSRDDFQEAGQSRNIVANPPLSNSLPIADLTQSLNRLTLQSCTPPTPSVNTVPSSPPNNPLTLPFPPPIISSPVSSRSSSPSPRSLSPPPIISSPVSSRSSSPSPPALPASVVGRRRFPKKDWDHRTVKALQILGNIETRIHCCQRLLLEPSGNVDQGAQQEVPVLRQSIDKINRKAEVVTARKQSLFAMLDDLKCHLYHRAETGGSPQGPVEINTDSHYQPPIDRMDVTAQVALLLGVICSVIFRVGTSAGNFIMACLSLVLYLAFQNPGGALSLAHENIIKQMPSTIGGALSKFNLMAKTIPYAVCSCHCTYPPTYSPGSHSPAYPTHCNHFPTPEVQCRKPLLDLGANGEHRPKKMFLYHDFKDYLAGLLSRPDIESIMDSACDDLLSSLSSRPQLVRDPFEATFLREFHGPDVKTLFIDHGEEGHYAFALHVDFLTLKA